MITEKEIDLIVRRYMRIKRKKLFRKLGIPITKK